MPGPGGLKRIKELHRLDKRREKEERKEQRRKERESRSDRAPPGEDPDIAGIVPGPQPPFEGQG